MKRADVLSVEKGIFPTRQKAIEAINSGFLTASGKVVKKPSEKFDENVEFVFNGDTLKYVSRGGFKLEGAIEKFNLNFAGKVVLDMGASTGGFTDCALQNGAKLVYAVDVGSSQLAGSLISNPKVISMEKTDIRDVDKTIFDSCDVIVGDLSFISIIKILEAIKDKITNQQIVLLIKPQFECGMDMARQFKGRITSFKLSKEICDGVLDKITKMGFVVKNLSESPIKGGDGNTEFICELKKEA